MPGTCFFVFAPLFVPESRGIQCKRRRAGLKKSGVCITALPTATCISINGSERKNSGERQNWNSADGLQTYISCRPQLLRSPKELTENIYLEQNTSTSAKISLLHKLFAAYKTEESDLVFYLKDNSGQEEKQNG